MTPLTKTIKREIMINGVAHVVTVSPVGVTLTKKGCRIGIGGTWTEVTANNKNCDASRLHVQS